MRSLLYVPGDQPDKIRKAMASGADGLILDIEDAVAPIAKPTARAVISNVLADPPPGHPDLWVRINWGSMGHDDIAAIVRVQTNETLVGLYVPKVGGVGELQAVDAAVGAAEHAAGRAVGSVKVCALLETGQGILDAAAIARGPRVTRLAIGEADLSSELGVELTPSDERELLTARGLLVLASAAAGIDPPVGPVSTDFRDPEALRASTIALRRMGFRGRAAIHPAQVAIINDVFTPSEADIAKATRLVEIYDAAIAAGSGVCVDDGGKMIDEAVVRGARRIVAQAGVRRR